MRRSLYDEIRRMVMPMATRLANTVARGIVQLADDSSGIQSLQLGVLAGEDVDDCERFQDYGVTSVPLNGAEAVVLFPDGDRTRPFVVGVVDRRHRPTGLQEGETAVYNNAAAILKLTNDGDVIIEPAPGRKVFVRRDGGPTERLVTLTELNAHTHPTGTGPSGIPSPQFVGTESIEVE